VTAKPIARMLESMEPKALGSHDSGYDMLYDLSLQGPPNTEWLAASAVALAIALVVLWRRRQRGANLSVPGFFAASFGLMAFVTAFSVWDHYRLQSALVEGRVEVVEGALQSYGVEHRAHYNSSTKRYDRSVAESFYVADVSFGFIRDASVAGYTNSGDEPLSFVQGQTLRVHYVEDPPGGFEGRRILRLERRRLPGPMAAGPAALAASEAVAR
jgi:hypothetical protein